MRKLIVPFFIFALAIPAVAQGYKLPKRVNLDATMRREFRKHLDTFNQLLTTVFRPIGWSRDGKFAYLIEPPEEEGEGFHAQLVIVDLATDKTLWTFVNKPDERLGPDGEPRPDNATLFWKRNEKVFEEKLKEYGIIQTQFSLLGKKFTSGGRAYTAKAVRDIRSDDDYGTETVHKLTVELSSPALGKKTVYSHDFTKPDELRSYDYAIAGAFKSPFEDRAAVILISVHRGWEGPPNVAELEILGADLKKGFKR